ncbi:bifunctional diguanylate cyclase/phosphodiesterase [Methylocaldum sp.]|uniref:putative bifunctional diguanylate cyclase/phosphodiesterase n=1 Tax=Methylocaldum sp. TaxID=1969727 RepID=UPI002D735359|nr:bifunctional diguanylate cyclase/phosphodiesterase [Methylocaldum sp.]HYE35566.1 bifunctional diguanylate cyclase/phosphodiesterase [Methylocaldum sp.]
MNLLVKTIPDALNGQSGKPSQLDALRKQVMEQLSALLESQTRTQMFGTTIRTMVNRVHANVIADLERDAPGPKLDILEHCRRLDRSLNLLADERQRQWHRNGKYIQEVLREFSQTMDFLASTLVEKDLFERQSQVLEQIIFSHERVTHWDEFVQEILADFRDIFPFDFFFIAFRGELGLSLFFYYFGAYPEQIKCSVKKRLIGEIVEKLKLSPDVPIEVEEYQVSDAVNIIDLKDIRTLTVPMPEYASQLAGLLGVVYTSAAPPGAQELSMIRSLLSVMVMVVGSSKLLGRTLEELEYYSGHDPLTGLYNRRRFTEMLEYEIDRSARHTHEFSILLLDLDNFKDINDSYGHPAGDVTLIQIGECLNGHLRRGDIAFRIGGDEFAVILPETPPTGALQVAESLRERLRGMRLEGPDGRQFYITTSIGLVSYPKDGKDAADLFAGVDIALYHAKGIGKDEVSTLEAADESVKISRDSRIYAEELRQALSEHRIIPYYQPIVDCRTGAVFAYEALARLVKPNREVVSAIMFIETIEKYGLARELDKAILKDALSAASTSIGLDGSPPRLFINLSAQEIHERGILAFAEELCDRLELPPSRVVFEIMERDAIGDMAHMRKFLAKLRRIGFSFALDDFGSGYNSFHYLRELHFEYVKIDGEFVCNILNSRIDRALVGNLSRLCRDLGIKTVAEFVECANTLTLLQEMGVDYAQGFHIGMPMPEFALKS